MPMKVTRGDLLVMLMREKAKLAKARDEFAKFRAYMTKQMKDIEKAEKKEAAKVEAAIKKHKKQLCMKKSGPNAMTYRRWGRAESFD